MAAQAGVLIECDVPCMKMLQHKNLEHGNEARDCIIEQLDETHVFVKADKVAEVRAELNKMLKANHREIQGKR